MASFFRSSRPAAPSNPSLADLLEPEASRPGAARRTVALVELSDGRRSSTYPAALEECEGRGVLRVVHLASGALIGEFSWLADIDASVCAYVARSHGRPRRTMTVDWHGSRAAEQVIPRATTKRAA
jgi:hypothetical protein